LGPCQTFIHPLIARHGGRSSGWAGCFTPGVVSLQNNSFENVRQKFQALTPGWGDHAPPSLFVITSLKDLEHEKIFFKISQDSQQNFFGERSARIRSAFAL
jgi:hypothetical protein